MVHSGSAAFTNLNDYQTSIGLVGMSVNLILPGNADFRARLTWLKQRHLHLLSARESVPRIASLSFVPTRAFVSFPVIAKKAIICGGVELRLGDIMFHSRGERTHQWTKGESKWGIVSVPNSQLAAYAKALTGREITAPPVARIFRPPASVGAHLRCLHLSACRLAETKPEMLAHKEVARAIEQELIHALINCLTADDDTIVIGRHQADVVLRFEDTFMDYVGLRPSISELCAALGVTKQTLRMYCANVLGVTPSQYMRLRRLQMARGGGDSVLIP